MNCRDCHYFFKELGICGYHFRSTEKGNTCERATPVQRVYLDLIEVNPFIKRGLVPKISPYTPEFFKKFESLEHFLMLDPETKCLRKCEFRNYFFHYSLNSSFAIYYVVKFAGEFYSPYYSEIKLVKKTKARVTYEVEVIYPSAWTTNFSLSYFGCKTLLTLSRKEDYEAKQKRNLKYVKELNSATAVLLFLRFGSGKFGRQTVSTILTNRIVAYHKRFRREAVKGIDYSWLDNIFF